MNISIVNSDEYILLTVTSAYSDCKIILQSNCLSLCHQVIGITNSEMLAAEKWNGKGIIEMLSKIPEYVWL